VGMQKPSFSKIKIKERKLKKKKLGGEGVENAEGKEYKFTDRAGMDDVWCF
jgi:hypothetical protein